jgi:hypothetical protein
MLPPQAEALYGKDVFINVAPRMVKEENHSLDDDWEPDPEAVQRFLDNRRFTVDITDEEIEQLKYKRRMRKML